MSETIRDGLQEAVETGWTVAHYIAVAGYQRLNGDDIETAIVMYTPTGQATYITAGLLATAEDGVTCEPVE